MALDPRIKVEEKVKIQKFTYTTQEFTTTDGKIFDREVDATNWQYNIDITSTPLKKLKTK